MSRISIWGVAAAPPDTDTGCPECAADVDVREMADGLPRAAWIRGQLVSVAMDVRTSQ